MISPGATARHSAYLSSTAVPQILANPSLQERVHCNCLGHSHTCSASIRKAMRRHHPKRDMQADLGAAYGVRMLSSIESESFAWCLVIRELIQGGHALTTYLTLIGCRTSGAKSICPRTRPISQQALPLNWLILCHGSQAVMTIPKRIMWLHCRRPYK